MGLFPISDTLVSTDYERRETLGGWQSREWKKVKRRARAVWRVLFPTYDPVVTTDLKQVCSGATNEIFYKERR
jgi:hypothetical protein